MRYFSKGVFWNRAHPQDMEDSTMVEETEETNGGGES